MYKIDPSKYQEILRNKIADNYKIDYKDTIPQINTDTWKFVNKLHIEDRLGKFKMKDVYILFKPNFENKFQYRLINPSKTELGKVTKNIIQNILINVQKIAIIIFRRTLMTLLNGLGILEIKAKPLLLNLS